MSVSFPMSSEIPIFKTEQPSMASKKTAQEFLSFAWGFVKIHRNVDQYIIIKDWEPPCLSKVRMLVNPSINPGYFGNPPQSTNNQSPSSSSSSSSPVRSSSNHQFFSSVVPLFNRNVRNVDNSTNINLDNSTNTTIKVEAEKTAEQVKQEKEEREQWFFIAMGVLSAVTAVFASLFFAKQMVQLDTNSNYSEWQKIQHGYKEKKFHDKFNDLKKEITVQIDSVIGRDRRNEIQKIVGIVFLLVGSATAFVGAVFQAGFLVKIGIIAMGSATVFLVYRVAYTYFSAQDMKLANEKAASKVLELLNNEDIVLFET